MDKKSLLGKVSKNFLIRKLKSYERKIKGYLKSSGIQGISENFNPWCFRIKRSFSQFTLKKHTITKRIPSHRKKFGLHDLSTKQHKIQMMKNIIIFNMLENNGKWKAQSVLNAFFRLPSYIWGWVISNGENFRF